MTPLSDEQITDALTELPGWAYENDSIVKTYTFGDFREAVSFIVRLAFHAEDQDHHPALNNVYNRVDVTLNTHDAGDVVTQKDIDLAKTIESFAWV
ncbi:MAG: 4a-hydroxytetrahydrobiopterin dehydratase [Bacteroidota bacterium]